MMKKVITEMTKDAVSIHVEGCDDSCTLILPVGLISPQISLQIAGMISSDPMLPRPKVTESDGE